MVQKVSGADQPVPLWTEEGFSVGKEPSKPLLYSLHFTLKVGPHSPITSPSFICYAHQLQVTLSNLQVSTTMGPKDCPNKRRRKNRKRT